MDDTKTKPHKLATTEENNKVDKDLKLLLRTNLRAFTYPDYDSDSDIDFFTFSTNKRHYYYSLSRLNVVEKNETNCEKSKNKAKNLETERRSENLLFAILHTFIFSDYC